MATNATDDDAGQATLQQWVDTFDLSHIPVLAVGDADTFDAWDLDDTCPSYWTFDGAMTVTTADRVDGVDWAAIGELL